MGPVGEVFEGPGVVSFGPPSSLGARGLLGKTLLEIEYVSPFKLQEPPQKLPFVMHCSMMFWNASLQ